MGRETKCKKHDLEAVQKELSDELAGCYTNPTNKQTEMVNSDLLLYKTLCNSVEKTERSGYATSLGIHTKCNWCIEIRIPR